MIFTINQNLVGGDAIAVLHHPFLLKKKVLEKTYISYTRHGKRQ